MNSLYRKSHFSTVIAFGLGLVACGQGQDSQTQSERATLTTYQQWCTNWQLDCGANPGDIEAPTAAEWKAISTLVNAYTSSASQLSVTRAESTDANLVAATKIVRVEDLYQRVQTRMRETDWQSLSLTAGAIVSKAGLEAADKAPSGLTYHWGTVGQTKFDDKGGVTFTGLNLSGPNQAPVAMKGLSMAADGTINLELADQTITGVPFNTIVHSLLGAIDLDLGAIKAKDIKTQEIVQAVSPLMIWLNKPTRVIDLNAAFFTKAAEQVPILAPAGETGNSLKLLVSTLASLKTSAVAGANLATVSAAAAVKCDWDSGDVKINLAKDFGVKRAYQASDSSYGLELYGVQVSGKKALGLTITLKRVETDKDKLTILDVPVIGKVALKWDDVLKSGDNAQLVCTK